jgi:hypothetical protein
MATGYTPTVAVASSNNEVKNEKCNSEIVPVEGPGHEGL